MSESESCCCHSRADGNPVGFGRERLPRRSEYCVDLSSFMFRVFSTKAEVAKRLRFILFLEASALASVSISSGTVTLILENPIAHPPWNLTNDRIIARCPKGSLSRIDTPTGASGPGERATVSGSPILAPPCCGDLCFHLTGSVLFIIEMPLL